MLKKKLKVGMKKVRIFDLDLIYLLNSILHLIDNEKKIMIKNVIVKKIQQLQKALYKKESPKLKSKLAPRIEKMFLIILLYFCVYLGL